NGSSPPSSRSRVKTAKAPRQKRRSVSWRGGERMPKSRLRRRRVASYLAARTPVRHACVVALRRRADDAAAARAGATCAAVDVTKGPWTIERRAHQPVRVLEDGAQLAAAEFADAAPRRDARLPQRLRLPGVAAAPPPPRALGLRGFAFPRHEPLVEERVADRTLALCPQSCQHLLEVGRF